MSAASAPPPSGPGAPSASPASTPAREFWAGVRDESPILLGVAPFGMIYGILAIGAGLPPFVAQAMSSIVFAGSSQFVAAQLIHDAAPALVVVVTVFVVNLRHALYSASVAGHVRHLSPGWKAALAYLLTDEAYAVAIARYGRDGARADVSPHRHWYFLGAGITLWGCWQVTTAVGIFLGAQVPSSWGLDFTLPLTFIAIVFPALRDRATAAAAVVGGAVAILARGAPFKLGLIVAAVAGILAGLAAGRVGAARARRTGLEGGGAPPDGPGAGSAP